MAQHKYHQDHLATKNWHFKSENCFLKLFNSYFTLSVQKILQLFHLTSSIATLTMHYLLQHPSHADVWQTIPNPEKLFVGTGVYMSVLLKLTCTSKNKNYHGIGYVYSSQDFPQKSGLYIKFLEGVIIFLQCAKLYWSLT